MSLRLSEIVHNPAALIREHKRQAPFRISEIGGPAELAIWRAEQAKKLEAYQARRTELKRKQVERIAGDAPLGELSWQGKAILADPSVWKEKQRLARERRKEYHQPQILTHLTIEKETKQVQIEEKPSFISKMKGFMSKVWHLATN